MKYNTVNKIPLYRNIKGIRALHMNIFFQNALHFNIAATPEYVSQSIESHPFNTRGINIQQCDLTSRQ